MCSEEAGFAPEGLEKWVCVTPAGVPDVYKQQGEAEVGGQYPLLPQSGLRGEEKL